MTAAERLERRLLAEADKVAELGNGTLSADLYRRAQDVRAAQLLLDEARRFRARTRIEGRGS